MTDPNFCELKILSFETSFTEMVGNKAIGLRLLLPRRIDFIPVICPAAPSARLLLGIDGRGSLHTPPPNAVGRPDWLYWLG